MLVAENNAVAAPSPAPTAVAVTNGNSFAQGHGFEDKAMRAKVASEIEGSARAKMEARMLESQQASTARVVESQQAFFARMESHLQSKFNEHAVQSRSKEEFHSLEAGRMATEMKRLQDQCDAEVQRRKQAEEDAAQN
jgi:hypothetical protein